MKVLYIGGTGEISYECVLRGASVGHEITVFNRGLSKEPLPGNVRQIVGDMNDAAAYARLGQERYDVVCQFLAYDPEVVRRDVKVFGGRCGQYVFISSASAYQKPPSDYVITEDVPVINPYWGYSQTKADMEHWLMDQHNKGHIPLTIVRPSHTYRRRFPGGIADGDDWAWRMLNGRPILIHGDGTSLWTFTHSKDFAVPFCNLLGRKEALGEAFHITQHKKAYMWNHILWAMGKALGVEEIDLAHIPTDTMVQYNYEWSGPLWGDKSWSVMFDNSKVMSVAGPFECKISMEEGLAGSAEHYFKYRAAAYEPNEKLHMLLDKIAEDQRGLGG